MSAPGSIAARMARLVCTALLALAWVSCQSGKSGPELGGETNWLAWCQNDEDCAVGSCVCGVCAASCRSEQSSCAQGPVDSSCFARGSFAHAALCDTDAAEGICLPPCATDADCAEGRVCRLGACSPPAAARDDATGGAPVSAEAARLSALAEFSDGWATGFPGTSLMIDDDLPCSAEAIECQTLEEFLSADACYAVSYGCGLHYVANLDANTSTG